MPYIPPSVVQEVKRMDLLTYLKNYEPYELVEYYGAAEPPVRCGESHLSGLTEPPHFIY